MLLLQVPNKDKVKTSRYANVVNNVVFIQLMIMSYDERNSGKYG
jgi:hypothetical protein